MHREVDMQYRVGVQFECGSWSEAFREAADYIDNEYVFVESVTPGYDSTAPAGNKYTLLLIGA